jgi:hypothetical protein
MDDKYGVSKSAASAWNSLNSYFDQAVNTPTGQRLRTFYEQGSKQVIDVHNEARHLANLKSGKTETVSSSGVPSMASTTASAPSAAETTTTGGPTQTDPTAVEKPAEGDRKV